MDDRSIIQILKSIGITGKEAEIYIFLSRYGPQKGLEIANQTKTHKALVYRILKNLQKKGIVESTFESPTRFIATDFEKVLDASIRTKREEVDIIEKAKKEALADWKKLFHLQLEPLERFQVIEGDQKIFSKMIHMILATKKQGLLLSNLSSLARGEQYGLFEAISDHLSKNNIKLRLLSQTKINNNENIDTIIQRISNKNLDIHINRNLDLKSSPKMFIQDNDEMIFFLSQGKDDSALKKEALCVWTNCKTIIQSFTNSFEQQWRDSTIFEKLNNNLSDIPIPQSSMLGKKANEKLYDIIRSAKKEILMIISSDNINTLLEYTKDLEDSKKQGVSPKVMMPVTTENFAAIQEISKVCEIKHVLDGYAPTIIVDNLHLFYLQEPISYISDAEYTQEIRASLVELWENAISPSKLTIQSILNPKIATNGFLLKKDRPFNELLKVATNIEEQVIGEITERQVLDKIITAKRVYAADPKKDINASYGSNARAVIHPPTHFKLPAMVLSIWHCNKQSSWGAEDNLTVRLGFDTSKGFQYFPVAHVTDNREALEYRKGVYAGTPAGQNCQLMDKDQFEVRVQGNTLFSGWTIPIKLTSDAVLPPSCILFEGHGKLVSGITRTHIASGRTQVLEFNRMAAFVTFYHPASKYSGPGIDGLLDRDAILTAYPPTI